MQQSPDNVLFGEAYGPGGARGLTPFRPGQQKFHGFQPASLAQQRAVWQDAADLIALREMCRRLAFLPVLSLRPPAFPILDDQPPLL